MTAIASSSTANTIRRRRDKRELQEKINTSRRDEEFNPPDSTTTTVKEGGTFDAAESSTRTKRLKTNLRKRHKIDSPSSGIMALLPSLIGIIALAFIIVGRMGFRGRATVAGIDLGTTNSVICVQQQSKGVGKIECIPDPVNNSPIVPSVVSFLDNQSHRKASLATKRKGSILLDPHPSDVLVGAEAKMRIDTHPHHTLYHAKRVLGRHYGDKAVRDFGEEVEFELSSAAMAGEEDFGVSFRVPFHHKDKSSGKNKDYVDITPQQVGSYVIDHLIQMTQRFLGHDNVKTAVIAVPAKFNVAQRSATVEAFQNAGVEVARILDEPVAAALAYGLQKKENVDYIMVYDFGGGTLDVSVLNVADGYVDVMGSDGDDRLGGADFDASIAHFLLEKKSGKVLVERVTKSLQSIYETLERNNDGQDLEELISLNCPQVKVIHLCTLSSFHTIAEQMKIELSAYPDGDGTAHRQCLALPDGYVTSSTISDFCSHLQPFQFSLTTDEYHNVCKPLYDRSVLPLKRILADLNLKKGDIDEVVLVGGSTRIPTIRHLVGQELGISRLNTHIDPDLTVAYGAASVID